jgi:hypothetical protein
MPDETNPPQVAAHISTLRRTSLTSPSRLNPKHPWRPMLYLLIAMLWTIDKLKKQYRRLDEDDRAALGKSMSYFLDDTPFKVVGLPQDREPFEVLLDLVEFCIDLNIYDRY